MGVPFWDAFFLPDSRGRPKITPVQVKLDAPDEHGEVLLLSLPDVGAGWAVSSWCVEDPLSAALGRLLRSRKGTREGKIYPLVRGAHRWKVCVGMGPREEQRERPLEQWVVDRSHRYDGLRGEGRCRRRRRRGGPRWTSGEKGLLVLDIVYSAGVAALFAERFLL